MDRQDEQFENFLREFVPELPRALHERQRPRFVWQRRLAVAAGIAIALGGSVWLASRRAVTLQMNFAQSKPEQTPIYKMKRGNHATLKLTKLAVEDPARFDEALSEEAPNGLPRFDRPNSALHVLAQR